MGKGQTRHYVHSDEYAKKYSAEAGTFTAWENLKNETDLLFYEGLHGAVINDDVDIANHADLKIGIVPVINLEWIQNIHRDKEIRRYSTEAMTDVMLRRIHAYVHCICLQFTVTDINFQQAPVVYTSNPLVATWIPTADESLVAIRFKDPQGINFSYLTNMIQGSWMSRANSIVVPGGKIDLAMQLIIPRIIERLVNQSRRASTILKPAPDKIRHTRKIGTYMPWILASDR